MNIDIVRDVLFPAPEDPSDHSFRWAVNPSYTSRDGLGMIMTTVRWISKGSDHWRDRRSVVQRMVSPDNGATWTDHGPSTASESHRSNNQNLAPHHFLDPQNGLLLSIYQTTRPGPADGGAPRTALHYEISSDQGKTWGPAKQLICRGRDLDPVCWLPGLIPGTRYIGVDQPKFAKLDDGTIVFGLTILRHAPQPNEQLYDCVLFLRGRWSDDGREITWEASEPVRVPPSVSSYGVDEADLVHLGGNRLLSTMRCEGMLEPLGLFSTRQWTISDDGGRTWSPPQRLNYEDGSMVCVPASLAAFEKNPATGKIYWFANILDKPVSAQMPRYPITIAELDPERICLIKDSVTTIQDLPPGAPANRMYSNFGHYIDRVTGEFVLTMAEKPRINDIDLRSDTIRFRIRIDNGSDRSSPRAVARDPRHQWFNDARFGLFVHWGPYASYGRGEQVLFREHLDQRDYARTACDWEPEHFDANTWAAVAKDAGMKYAVFTTRHHDGFCLWDTNTTDYSSVAQRAKRDFVAEYVEAFRSAGLRVGLYYSVADWRIPAYWSDVHDNPQAWDRFRDYIHEQVRELLSNYGRIDVLWFDGAWPHNAERWQSEKLLEMVRRLQPGIMVNNRLDCVSPYQKSPYTMEAAGDSAELGDFGTPEHQIIADPRRFWESCQVSTWRLWGYAHGERWRSADFLLDMLVEAASQGGNLLLNVGPDADSRFPQPFVDRAVAIGEWLRTHGEALYGSEAGDVCEFVTRGRQTRKGNNLYLIIRFWDGQPTLRLAGLATKVNQVTLLTTGDELRFQQDDDELLIHDLPAQPPTDLFPVIKLQCDGPPQPQPWAKDRLWSGDPRRMLGWAKARGTSVWTDGKER